VTRLKMKIKRIADIAEEEATKSHHHYKLGAVIFKQGKVISKGHNDTKRGFSGYRGFWEGSLHAEIAAIIKSRTDVSGCSILVRRRYGRDSSPCPNCMAAIKGAGLKKVYFYKNDELIVERL